MRRAFTLIELLVVVTIIVVLLALLVPAMDKAIYQAELAVCGAKLRAIGGGASVYAFDNQRHYPYRIGVRDDMTWPAAQIYNGNPQQNTFNLATGSTNTNVYDDRQILSQFMDYKETLVDPLSGGIDLANIDADSTATGNYSLWFGYKFFGNRGMKKVGDRWTAPDAYNTDQTWRFDILASDFDWVFSTDGTKSSHPDQKNIAALEVYQNQDNFVAGFKSVTSYWFALGNVRSSVDLNYVFQDGSVQRLNNFPTYPDNSIAYIQSINTGANGWTHTMPALK